MVARDFPVTVADPPAGKARSGMETPDPLNVLDARDAVDAVVHAWHRVATARHLPEQEAADLCEQMGCLALNMTAAGQEASVPETAAAYWLYHVRYHKLARLPVASPAELERAQTVWRHAESTGVAFLAEGRVWFASPQWQTAWCVDTLCVRPLRLRLLRLLARPAFRVVWQCWARAQPEVCDEVVERLRTATHHTARFRAATILGWIADPRSVAPLIAALDDASGGVRIAAAEALAAIGDPRAIAHVIESLRVAPTTDHHLLAAALEHFGVPAVLPTIALLDDEQPHMRLWAIYLLARLGDGRALDPLVARLRTEHEERLKHVIIDALGKLGLAAVPALVETLADPPLRASAATALSRIGDSRALTPLLAALTDQAADASYAPQTEDAATHRAVAERARSAMCRALATLATAETFDLFRRMLRTGAPAVRPCAATALANIGGPEAARLLRAALRDPLPAVRAAAIDGLGQVGVTRLVADIIHALRDPYASVRLSAANALGKLGGGRAVAALCLALKDEDLHVQYAAAWALLKLGDQRAIEPLIRALSNPAAPRTIICKALGTFGDARAVAPLIDLLGGAQAHPHPATRDVIGAAIRALAELGDARAVAPLIDVLADAPPDAADQAASAECWVTRTAAVEVLGKLGDARAVAPLIAVLARGQEGTTWSWERQTAIRAATALGAIGDPRALRALAQAQRSHPAGGGLNQVAMQSSRHIRERMRAQSR